MRILMVSAAYPPYISGVATATANLAEALSQNHRLLLFAGNQNTAISHEIISHSFEIYRFPGVKIKRQKAHLTLPYPHPSKIQKLIGFFQPDVIHLQDVAPMSLAILAIARKEAIPTVMTHHFTAEFIVKTLVPEPNLSQILSNSRPAQQLIYRLVNLFYNRGDLLTVPNPKLIPSFQTAGLKVPVTAIPNGIITKKFQRRIKLKHVLSRYRIRQPQIILYVGRLEIDKNLEILIDAFGIVHRYNPQSCLVLVGDGNKKKLLLARAKKLGAEKAVYLLGKIANNDSALSHLYNAASVFASASIIENQSVAFIEAMAAGLPLVAARTPISINSPLNGLEFEPDSSADLAVCLQKILSDQKLRKTISRYNRLAGRQYDIAITSRQYLKAYQSLQSI